jgi:hypothetical protein
LSQALGTLETPGAPGLLAAAFGDGRDSGLWLQGRGGRIPFALFPEGAEETRSEDGTGPGEGRAERELGIALGPLRDGGVAIGERLHGDTALGHKGWHQEGMGHDAPRIRGQGQGGSDGLETARDDLWRAHMRGPETACEGVERRARCTAVRVGPLLRKSQKSGVSLACNQGRTCGA